LTVFGQSPHNTFSVLFIPATKKVICFGLDACSTLLIGERIGVDDELQPTAHRTAAHNRQIRFTNSGSLTGNLANNTEAD